MAKIQSMREIWNCYDGSLWYNLIVECAMFDVFSAQV